MISERQIKIITILYMVEKYITLNEIAEQLMVSVKTVRNDIKTTKAFLSEREIGKLITKPHVGVRLMMTQLEWENLNQEFQSYKVILRDDMDVLFAIIYVLLKKRMACVSDFEKNLYASRALVDKNINLAKLWFNEKNITLEYNKRKKLEIKCTEYNWRLAMWDFFEKFGSWIKNETTNKVVNCYSINDSEYNAITEILDGFDMNGMMDALHLVEEKYGFKYNYISSVRALLLISLSLIGTRKKMLVDLPEFKSCNTDGTFDAVILDDLLTNIELYYHIELPDCEREYIRFVLNITEIQEFVDDQAKQFYQSCNDELFWFTINVVKRASEICNVNLNDDYFLIENLFLELRPMIERLKRQITFETPLLMQIKKNYPNMLAIEWSVGDIFEKELGLMISENEVRILTLHLNGSIERCTTCFRVCIVCNYGVGISYLLKEKIERKINDIKIIDVLSIRDRQELKNLDCDFVISTISIDESKCNQDVVVVDSLLLLADIKNIENKMYRLNKERLNAQVNKIDSAQKRSIFNEELIYINLQVNDKTELINLLCNRLESKGYVTKEFEASVLERETKTSTEIGHMIALPHGYSRYVKHSVVSVVVLDKPMKWFEDNEVDLLFLLAFDLDESKRVSGQIVKFYKSFALFSENDQLIQEFKKIKSTEEFVNCLNNL